MGLLIIIFFQFYFSVLLSIRIRSGAQRAPLLTITFFQFHFGVLLSIRIRSGAQCAPLLTITFFQFRFCVLLSIISYGARCAPLHFLVPFIRFDVFN